MSSEAKSESLGLDEGEHLIAWLPVSFSRAFGTTNSPGQQRRGFTGVGSYRRWAAHADSVGFPVGGMAMTLVVTERRLCVCRPTFVSAHPKRLVGSLELNKIVQAVVIRRGLAPKLTILLHNSGIVEFELSRARRARRFVEALLAARDAQAR